MTERLKALSDAGVSIWLDDLSRERIETGNLAELVTDRSVVGVTTNPTIFASALSKGERYEKQVAELKAAGADVDATVFALTTTDVRDACDVLRPVYDATDGFDGRVSIEVEPGLARDTDGTVAMAEKLWNEIDRPNVMIKIPATREGLPAIAAAIAKGISVNVTLIFSLERYRGVMDAYLYGLEQAAAEGRDLSKIHSVASFFISRVDAEVDGRLPEDSPLRGKAALANAQLAYATFQEIFGSDRAKALLAKGAHPQRPLWASTGVKDPAYSDTLYVTELVVDGTVNTMPEKTLEAFADHGEVKGDTVTGRGDEAQRVWDELEAQGITYDEVVEGLETEGLKKFDDSWTELLETVRAELDKA
ncbi:transaldolase [Aeromicrobium sp. 636]|uniref:Transaldolase n=1 Tax=Aeromicrobium senzhongii TaxID=2663859 RepID=A0A8I0ESP9_9ACTN|nr:MULTISPECIES: transaldolase [Aeromicrobium]MBC9224928.1 transaldolase [Aeromicrobium senzhongii]MCQ3997040.1 transaldolase [Aeromicrobium sp. 636]